MAGRFADFEGFWPFYVAQHRDATNRALHFIGTSLVFVFLAAGFAVSPRAFFLMPIAGYGFAWVGHFFFEKNKPATFIHPLWSLRGDFRMYRLTLLGRMAHEIARSKEAFPAGA